MSNTIQMDQSGRLVLPKALREHFRLNGGDTLSIEVKGDTIELRPQKQLQELKRVNGVLVLSGGHLPTGQDFVTDEREGRIQDLLRRGVSS